MTKASRIFLSVVLMTSLIPVTTTATNAITALKKGVPAPYTGVLLPEDEFRWFKSQELQATELDKYILSNPPDVITEPVSMWEKILFFGVGAIMGGFVVHTIAK